MCTIQEYLNRGKMGCSIIHRCGELLQKPPSSIVEPCCLKAAACRSAWLCIERSSAYQLPIGAVRSFQTANATSMVGTTFQTTRAFPPFQMQSSLACTWGTYARVNAGKSSSQRNSEPYLACQFSRLHRLLVLGRDLNQRRPRNVRRL